jgi:hypothetical protein
MTPSTDHTLSHYKKEDFCLTTKCGKYEQQSIVSKAMYNTNGAVEALKKHHETLIAQKAKLDAKYMIPPSELFGRGEK